jgi:glutaredoxin
MIILYTNHCPACDHLKELLEEKKIQYKEVDDEQFLVSHNLIHMPQLGIDDNTILKYKDALNWVNEQN